MHTRQYLLFQNEGFLMQGCLLSAFQSFKTFASRDRSEKAVFYPAFLNYSAGVERLLKLILVLDHYLASKGQFPTEKELRDFGHDLIKLYDSAAASFPKYRVTPTPCCKLDELDRRFLAFFSGFARSSRYFNLSALTGSERFEDPLGQWGKLLDEVYQADVPESERVRQAAEVDHTLVSLPAHIISWLGSGLDGQPQSLESSCHDEGKMQLAMPEVIWRLVKLLVLPKILLSAQCSQLSGDENIPYLHEFLRSINPERQYVVGAEGWPYD